MTTAEPIKVLLVEDNPGDVLLIRSYLEAGGPRRFVLTTAGRLEKGMQHLAKTKFDVVLLDLSLPDSQGWASFARLQDQALAVPIVILTGLQDEEMALRAVSSGAQDYLVKGEISGSLLGRTLNYAIERSQLVEQQRKLNRALNVLSDVNQTVVRAGEEQQLLGDICTILINYGYRLAWVARGDLAGDGQALPVAWAGAADADLKAVTGRADNQGSDPAQAPLHSSEIRIVQDVRQDPSFVPWREAALEHGLLAFLALPLISGQHSFGTLNIYASTPGAFDDQEVQLLLELRSDLAYGLDALRTNRALRQSEEKFAKAFQVSPIGIALTNLKDERILDVNDSALKLFGYEREQVLGRTSAELDLWADRSWRPQVSSLLNHHCKLRDLEVTAQSRSGVPRYALASFEQIQVGDTAAVLTLLHDITERREAEEKLRHYNEHLTVLREIEQAILAARSPTSIAQATLSRLERLIPYQRASVALFDLNREEVALLAVSGLSAGQLQEGAYFTLEEYGNIDHLAQGHYQVVPDMLTSLESPAVHQQLLTAGLRSLISVPLLTRNRLLGVLNLASTRSGAFTREQAEMAQDVAGSLAVALQNAQLFQQTQEQARQMQQIVETVPEGMVLLDAAHQILLLNPTATAYLADLGPKQVGDVLEHLGKEPLARFLEPQADGLPWHELAIKEGSRLFEVAARPIQEQSQTRGWVVVLRDVTEERERQRYLQARDRLATVGQLAAGIAHDFNNIMAIITLYSETLERKPDYERRLLYLRTIREQAQHAARLIEQILDFSRRSVVEQSRLDLAPFVKEVTKLLKRTLPETVIIHFAAGEGHYVVNVDPTRLQQVLMNLAINARDAMPHGGRLQISLDPLSFSAQQRPPLPGMAPGNWVCLSVADSGAGIQPDDLPHVFEPFFTTKQAGRGVGLGLAQVYGIVKQHEGEIRVTSTVGEGTRFDIYLPTTVPCLADQESGPGAALAGGEGQLILLVEDNEAARSAIAHVLEMLDYRVLEVENGEEALALFNEKSTEIALIISDMVMPGMGGSELYTRLKQIQPDVKVVLMTGYPRKEEKDLLEQGVVAWMQKPFQAEKLAETIGSALGEPSLALAL